jgi:hypothetical protein
MTKSESQKIRRQKERFDKVMRPVDKFLNEIKKIIKEEKNKMMYGKKETNRIDRFAYELIWWAKLVVIFLAFSYVMGFGR